MSISVPLVLSVAAAGGLLSDEVFREVVGSAVSGGQAQQAVSVERKAGPRSGLA